MKKAASIVWQSVNRVDSLMGAGLRSPLSFESTVSSDSDLILVCYKGDRPLARLA